MNGLSPLSTVDCKGSQGSGWAPKACRRLTSKRRTHRSRVVTACSAPAHCLAVPNDNDEHPERKASKDAWSGCAGKLSHDSRQSSRAGSRGAKEGACARIMAGLASVAHVTTSSSLATQPVTAISAEARPLAEGGPVGRNENPVT